MAIPHIERLEMSTLARVLTRLSLQKTDNQDIISQLIRSYSDIFTDELMRYIKYRERTEIFDVWDESMNLHLPGFPIGLDPSSGDPLIDIANDINSNPDFSTSLSYPEDYRVDHDEDGMGTVNFNVLLLPGYKVLQVEWTGGMATKTTIEGTDGVTSNPAPPPGQLVSASSTFVDDLVESGDIMTIRAGADAGDYPIVTVVDNNTLEFGAAFGNPAVDQSFIIETAGFVGRYPKIEEALIDQIVFHWKQKDKIDIQSMNIGGAAGAQVTYTKFRPLDLLPEVQRVLDIHRLEVYP